MANCFCKPKSISTPAGKKVLRIKVGGVISTPTLRQFRDDMERLIDLSKPVLLDFSKVDYINSSGLGELVRWHDTLKKADHSLVVAELTPDITRLLAMLGLLNVLHVFPREALALQAIDIGEKAFRKMTRRIEKAQSEMPQRRGDGFVPTVSMPVPKLPQAHLLLGMPPEDPFTQFLARSLSGKSGHLTIATRAEEVRAALKDAAMDVAILDSQLDELQQICAALKIAPRDRLCSIILVDDGNATRRKGVRVREDECIHEPFEVRELVALATGEFGRCEEESLLFLRDLDLSIRSSQKDIDKTLQLVKPLLDQAGLAGQGETQFLFAIREALDNACRHGNGSDPKKEIHFTILVDKEKVTVALEDEGKGFDFDSFIKRAQKMTPAEQARERQSKGGVGGIGIGLMLRSSDKVIYSGPGNELKLTKYRG